MWGWNLSTQVCNPHIYDEWVYKRWRLHSISDGPLWEASVTWSSCAELPRSGLLGSPWPPVSEASHSTPPNY